MGDDGLAVDAEKDGLAAVVRGLLLSGGLSSMSRAEGGRGAVRSCAICASWALAASPRYARAPCGSRFGRSGRTFRVHASTIAFARRGVQPESAPTSSILCWSYTMIVIGSERSALSSASTTRASRFTETLFNLCRVVHQNHERFSFRVASLHGIVVPLLSCLSRTCGDVSAGVPNTAARAMVHGAARLCLWRLRRPMGSECAMMPWGLR